MLPHLVFLASQKFLLIARLAQGSRVTPECLENSLFIGGIQLEIAEIIRGARIPYP